MISLKHCLRAAVPAWVISKRVYREMDRFDRNAISDAEQDERRARLQRSMDKGENAYRNVDHTLDQFNQKRKENLMEGLREFQNRSGINEEKYIKEVEKANSPRELNELEAKFNRASNAYYEKQLRESGAFTPIHAKEARFLGAEMGYLKDMFKDQPFYKKGKLCKVDILADLKDSLRPRIEFRNKLRRVCQNPMVRDEYFSYFDDQLKSGRVDFNEFREKRLENIMKELKDVEDSPHAVQNEFRKLQAARQGKDTAELKKEVMAGFKKRTGDYTARVLENMELFGGDMVDSPHGKIREAAAEFIEWFEELKDFTTMDGMADKLDKVLNERKGVYEERDKLLKNVTPQEAEKIKARTDKMRFHNLKAYLPELKSKLGKSSVHALEFSALLEDAEASHVALFTAEEKIKMKTQMYVAPLELQKAKLTVLEQETIPERTKVVNDYFRLPDHLRKDKPFIDANFHDRQKMLDDALAQQNREAENPLDLSSVDHFDGDAEALLLNKLRSSVGKKEIEDKAEEMDQQGKLNIGRVQAELYKRMYGVDKRMAEGGMSQKETYLEDLSLWMRRSRDLWKKDVDEVQDNDRDKWQVEALEADRDMYDAGYVRTSGGEMRKLGIIKEEELMQGKTETLETIKEAKYPQHLLLLGQDGKDELHVTDKIEKRFMEFAMRMLQELMRSMGAEMHLNAANQQNYINSSNIRREMAKMVIDDQFAQYFDRGGANNSDHFVNELAA